MPKPIVTFRPELEDPDGNEIVLAFSNGAEEWPEYCGGLFRLRVLPSSDMEAEIYGQSKGEGKQLTIYVPKENRPPGASVEAFLVSASGGVLLVVNDIVVGLIDYSWFPPDFTNLLETAFAAADLGLQWVEDVDGEAEHLARIAGQTGIPEADVLQQALDHGQLKRQRTQKVRQVERQMYQPLFSPATVGVNIRLRRELLGLSVEELAAHTSLETFRILAFEGGLEIIFAQELVLIADALELEDPALLLYAA